MGKYSKIKAYSYIFIFLIIFLLSGSISEATSGCCSWHGGVCGCDSSVGRQVCCDGSYSPSCTCAYNPPVYTPLVQTTVQKKTWCGVGDFFATKEEAQKNIDDYYNNKCKPLLSEIDSKNKTISGLEIDKNNLTAERDKFKKEADDNNTAFGWTFWILIASLIAHWIVYSKRKKL